jgi:uncharacterized membrane protein YjdF
VHQASALGWSERWQATQVAIVGRFGAALLLIVHDHRLHSEVDADRRNVLLDELQGHTRLPWSWVAHDHIRDTAATILWSAARRDHERWLKGLSRGRDPRKTLDVCGPHLLFAVAFDQAALAACRISH